MIILVLKVLRRSVPAQEDGEEGNAGGREPSEDDHQDGRPHGDGRMVHQRPSDGVISVNSFIFEINISLFSNYYFAKDLTKRALRGRRKGAKNKR